LVCFRGVTRFFAREERMSMMPLFSSRVIREADLRASEEYGLAGMVLMENAGAGAYRFLRERFPRARRLVVLAGAGNNGGDGFVLARHALLDGLSCRVFLVADPENYRGDARSNLDALRLLGGDLRCAAACSDAHLLEELSRADVLVDALLGTGSTGAPRGQAARLVALAGTSAVPVFALDLPSGIDADTGAAHEPHVSAVATATFLAPKRGLFIFPGADAAGEVRVIPIGVPPAAVLPRGTDAVLFDAEDVRRFFPFRRRDTHKGRQGTVLVLGGSANYSGAPLLAALGALRSGSGLVVLVVPEAIADRCAAALPEAVLEPVPGTRHGPGTFAVLENWKSRAEVLLAGPGLGRDPETLACVRKLWRTWTTPVVFDADALFALADPSGGIPFRADAVVTPHEGECARLLGLRSTDVAAARLDAVRRLGEALGCAVLKGPHTLVHLPDIPNILGVPGMSDLPAASETRETPTPGTSDVPPMPEISAAAGARRANTLQVPGAPGTTLVIAAGSPGLAVPGSGDVLGGVLAGLLARGLAPGDAAGVACWLHGAAGERLAATRGEEGLLASEIAEALPGVIEEVRHGKTGKRATKEAETPCRLG
jgi:NAD(P)H-hydrate epimerase